MHTTICTGKCLFLTQRSTNLESSGIGTLFVLENFIPFLHHPRNYRNCSWYLLCSEERRSVSGICLNGIHHDKTSFRLYHQGSPPLDTLHGRKRFPCTCVEFFTGAYSPRELNWLIGVALMALTIVFGYSGYLLPWDSLAYGLQLSESILQMQPL